MHNSIVIVTSQSKMFLGMENNIRQTALYGQSNLNFVETSEVQVSKSCLPVERNHRESTDTFVFRCYTEFDLYFAKQCTLSDGWSCLVTEPFENVGTEPRALVTRFRNSVEPPPKLDSSVSGSIMADQNKRTGKFTAGEYDEDGYETELLDYDEDLEDIELEVSGPSGTDLLEPPYEKFDSQTTDRSSTLDATAMAGAHNIEEILGVTAGAETHGYADH